MCSPIVQERAKSETLVGRAGSGRLLLCPNKSLTREDIIVNEEVLIPVIKHLGLRLNIDQLHEHVHLFFEFARPRGKTSISRFLPAMWNTIGIISARDMRT